MSRLVYRLWLGGVFILCHTSQSMTHAACRYPAVAPLTVCLFGCRGSEPKARSQWFDALTIAWLELVVKEVWSARQVAQCQGCLPYSVVGVSLISSG